MEGITEQRPRLIDAGQTGGSDPTVLSQRSLPAAPDPCSFLPVSPTGLPVPVGVGAMRSTGRVPGTCPAGGELFGHGYDGARTSPSGRGSDSEGS